MNIVVLNRTTDMIMGYSTLAAEQGVISWLTSAQAPTSQADYSYDDTVAAKKLTFAAADGAIAYAPSRGTPAENWFMSHLNMAPGGTYADALDIENLSGKTFTLYLKAVPLAQAANLDALLQLIHIKVTYDGAVIYDGTAAGTPGTSDLRGSIPLGEYAPGATKKITVELTLDPSVGLEYAGLLTQIDWQFDAEEVETIVEDDPPLATKLDLGLGDKIKAPETPKAAPAPAVQPLKTGDGMPLGLLSALCYGAAAALVLLAWRMAASRRRGGQKNMT